MSFIDLAKKRCSIRNYKADPVPEDIINAVLEAGRLAPSACNIQPWHIVVVRDEKKRKALGQAYQQPWFWKAPVILIICTEPAVAWRRSDKKSYADVDGAILMDHITLCATDLGYATCWIGAFDPAVVKSTLHLPEGIEPLAMAPFGKAAEVGRPKNRKNISEIVHLETW